MTVSVLSLIICCLGPLDTVLTVSNKLIINEFVIILLGSTNYEGIENNQLDLNNGSASNCNALA